MNWLNKILRKSSHEPAKAVARVVQVLPTPVALDLPQLRQRMTQTLVREEREKLERDLGAALAEAKQAPGPDEPVVVRIAAVNLVSDQASALAWLVDLAGDDSLAEVALHARFAEVRRAAAQRLDSDEALERVAEASRVKDKGVYRHCMSTLRERQALRNMAVRADSLERELEILQLADPVPVARLMELEKELNQLDSGVHGRCSELFEELRTRMQEQSRALQRLHARQAEAQTLADELTHAVQEEQCGHQQSRWRELAEACADWPSWLAQHKDMKALQHLLGEIESRLAQAAEDLQRFCQAEAFLAMHAQEAPLTQEAMAAWAALAKPDNPQLQEDLQSRWQACLNKAAQKAQAVEKAREVQKAQKASTLRPPSATSATAAIDRDVLQKRLELLEAALEQGHLAEAIKCEAAIDLPENAAAAGFSLALAQRLSRAHAQLLQLRGWARWGTDQARQQLILKAEQLVQENLDVAALSGAIVELRKEWKGLDVHGAANHALWERFDAAIEQAYVPVAAYRAEQAVQRSVARLAKEAHCLEWENWFAQINWQDADIQVIQAMRQEICNTWRAAAPADRRDERTLQKRFGAILGGLDVSLDAARNGEIARRELLISAAETLRDEANLRHAIEGVKALQQRWRDEAGSVQLARAAQEKLWKKFRGVCDAIFARREEEKVQLVARRAEERNQLAAQRALRAEEAQKQQAELDRQAQQRRTPYELMAQKMAIAEQLEHAALSGMPMEKLTEEAESAWRNLSRLPAKFEQALARRLAHAAAATMASLADGLTVKQGLLLDLEIALGLDSPDHQQESRRMRNIELLRKKFSNSPAGEADVDQLILTWHATPATADEQQQLRMTAILRKQLANKHKP